MSLLPQTVDTAPPPTYPMVMPVEGKSLENEQQKGLTGYSSQCNDAFNAAFSLV